MNDRTRITKVFIALVVSMTAGALILMSLDKQPISATGVSSLSRLNSLPPINEVKLYPTNWDGVEVYYSGSSVNTVDKLIKLGFDQLHFVITGGDCETEGLIKSTDKWGKQAPCSLDMQQGQKIIRICILNDSRSDQPTNCQITRTQELVELLRRKYDINPARIRYPVNWQI